MLYLKGNEGLQMSKLGGLCEHEFLSAAYHSKCIDPWLTGNRRVCPVCKRKVFAAGEQVTETESESESDDTSPLIRPSSYGTQGGTFVPQIVRIFFLYTIFARMWSIRASV